MSVSVDTVYQRVLSILNKEQRGYVTPQEFNLFANQAQLDLFEQYFYDINQFGRLNGNSTEYSDMLTILNEKINLFETTADLFGMPHPTLAGAPTPIDAHFRAGNVGRHIRTQKQGHIGNLCGPTQAPHGNTGFDRSIRLRC